MQTEPTKDGDAGIGSGNALSKRNGGTGLSVPTVTAKIKPGDRPGRRAAPGIGRGLPPWSLVLIGMFLGGVLALLVWAIKHHRAAAADYVVAVNGTEISKGTLDHRLEIEAGIPTMHKLVEEQLQLQFAKQQGLAPTDAQVEKEYAKLSAKPGFAQALQASGQTPSDVRLGIRIQLAKSAVLTQGVTVADSDAQRYYQAQSDPGNPSAQFYRPPAIVLRAIETPTRADADKALAELNASTPFELVVTTYSQDASKNNGGLLSPLIYGRSPLHRSPALENAVFAMKVGGQIGPVAFNNQWWIFGCVNKSAAAKIPYAEVRDQCLSGAKLAKALPVNGKKVETEFSAFQRSSNLQPFWPQYRAALGTK